jgi:hypothetical protein
VLRVRAGHALPVSWNTSGDMGMRKAEMLQYL